MERTNIPITSETQYSEHAYNVLKTGFVLAPIVAGADKFFNYLTEWPDYLAPFFPELLNVSPNTFMMGVGVVEIVVGIGVLVKPKIFAYVLSAWLLGIIFNLFMLGGYYDIALRDLGLALGAFALGQLAVPHEHHHHAGERSWRRDHHRHLSNAS